jgi:prolipoprotein diacylglyceryltransferase
LIILKFGKSLKAGQSFALYVATYCLGRFFIELIRIDTANTIAGLRVNVWVSLLVGLGAALYYARASKKIQ